MYIDTVLDATMIRTACCTTFVGGIRYPVAGHPSEAMRRSDSIRPQDCCGPSGGAPATETPEIARYEFLQDIGVRLPRLIVRLGLENAEFNFSSSPFAVTRDGL